MLAQETVLLSHINGFYVPVSNQFGPGSKLAVYLFVVKLLTH